MNGGMTVTETKQPPMMAPRAPVSQNSESPDRSKTASQLDYRPDIDGLRAISVLAVIGFHAFPAWIRGGFIGVDVFFVISGYLISAILFTGMERDSFRFSQFYIRRQPKRTANNSGRRQHDGPIHSQSAKIDRATHDRHRSQSNRF